MARLWLAIAVLPKIALDIIATVNINIRNNKMMCHTMFIYNIIIQCYCLCVYNNIYMAKRPKHPGFVYVIISKS